MTITDVNSQDPDTSPDDEAGQSRAWRSLFRRRRPSDSENPQVISADVVRWEIQEEEPKPEGWAWVEKHALTLPDARYVKARLKHAAPKVPGIVIKFVMVKTPQVVWTEAVQPIWAGGGKCVNAYVRWVTATHLDAAQQVAEGPLKARTLVQKDKNHTYRIWASIIAALVASGSMAYLYVAYYIDFWVVVLTILGILDLIGRAGTEKTKEFSPVYREPWHEGMSYKQLTETLQSAFNEIVGINADTGYPLVRMDGVCSYDFHRQEWRQLVSTYRELDGEKHMRALERAVGWRPRSFTLLEVPESATRQIIVVRDGDALAEVPQSPDEMTSSRSILQPILLGRSKNPDQPFALGIAGVHVIVVAKIGGGKTVHFDNLIDGVTKCCDAVAWGINIAKRHAFSKWRGAVQKVARTPEEADKLLDDMHAEIQRRMDILDERAQSDDPEKHTDEWDPITMGPALIVFIDEFPQLASFNGQPKDTLNLLKKVEDGARLGREVMVSFVMAFQKWGNADAGSTVVSSQSTIVICGPCDADTAGEIFGYKERNQGWTPHHLKPANKYAVNDAGKAFIKGPGFGPDEVRGWTPLTTTQTIERATKRVQDGLPKLENNPQDDTIEGKVVPNMLCALAAAYDDIEPVDGKLPSALAAEWITEHSREEIDATELAKRLKTELGDLAPRAKSMRNKLRGNCSCYLGEDINDAMEAL